jgi:hypothetical protein
VLVYPPMLTSTRFQKSIKSPADAAILKQGKNNKKLGYKITKGRHKGKYLYSLTLTERDTCPTTCHHWDDCYGNNMPFAHRFQHGPELEKKLDDEIGELVRKHDKGIVVRLHVLGDFYSTEYVFHWGSLLDKYPTLSAYGYTATYDNHIGGAIALVSVMHPNRFDIRYSTNKDYSKASDFRYAADESFSGDFFDCPEQTGQVKSCADCAACWQTTKTVRFKSH